MEKLRHPKGLIFLLMTEMWERFSFYGIITGEMTIRAGTARSVVLYIKMGMTVEEAVYEAAKDFKALKGGYLDEVTIHAIDKDVN